MPAIDLQGAAFAAGGPGLEIATGDPAHPVVLDFRKEVYAIDVGYFEASTFSLSDLVSGSDLSGPRAEAAGVDLVRLGILAASTYASSVGLLPPPLQVAGAATFAKRGVERVTLVDGRQIDVMSLGFSMTDVRGFLGPGKYWGRDPGTGRVDGSVADEAAIGVVIDDLDLAVVGMLRMPTGLDPVPAIYVAAAASLESARVVGVENLANAELSNVELQVNLVASTDFNVVDFGKSTHAVVDSDGSVATAAGYAVAGPRNAPAVILDYTKPLLATKGRIDVNLFDVGVLTGDFLLRASGSNMLLYVDGTSRLGPTDAPWIASDVEAFLRLDARGLVSRVILDTDPITIGSAIEILPGSLNLLANTTGEDASFTIPEELRRPGQPDTITVSAIPPGKTEAAGYVVASGSGRVRLTDAFTFDGRFDLRLERERSTFVFDSTLDLPVLEPLRIAGALEYLPGSDGGLFGSVAAAPVGGDIIAVPGITLGGEMLLEVNTSPVVRQVRSIRRAGEDDPDGDGYVRRDVPANVLRLGGNGRLEVGGASFVGSQSLTFEPGRIRLDLASGVDVGFGSLAVTGEAWLLYGETEPTTFVLEGAARGSLGAVSGIAGTVLVNTAATDVTLTSGTVVAANTPFDVRLNAVIDIGLFKLDVGGRLFKQGDLWEIGIDRGRGRLNFFDVASLAFDGFGFYRSNGAYLFEPIGTLSLGGKPLWAEATVRLSLGRDAAGATSFKGDIWGTSRYEIDTWLGPVKGDGPPFRGTVAFSPRGVSFATSVQLPIIGWFTLGPFDWRWRGDGGIRPDPVIARLADGVLTLSSGDAADRYGDAGGQWYGSLLNESFQIEAVRNDLGRPIPGQVRVRSLGYEREFTGVTTIRAAGGQGNDSFEIGPDVDAVLDLDGGPGSDIFLVGSLVPGSRFDGGSGTGYDELRLAGRIGDYSLTSIDATTLVAEVESPAATAATKKIDMFRFGDGSVGAPAVSTDTRALAGPIVNGRVFFDLRTYAGGGVVANSDIHPSADEPSTTTDSRGAFNVPDSLLAAHDQNGDGVVDFRDGMVVVGNVNANGIGTTTSVVDSITGSDLGFPLVGLPGHGASLVTTIKYATLLRWRPDQRIAGVPVTPELINAVFPILFADAPSTVLDDDFDPYLALSSADPAVRASAVDTLRFSYTHLTDILTVTAMLREFGLDYGNEAAWGYRPDPTRADRLEVVAFSAYSYAIATRFGTDPFDSQGRPPLAPAFDATNRSHVREVLLEILAAFPTRRLLEAAPEILADFVADPTPAQGAVVRSAIERHFGQLLDNASEGLVLTTTALARRIVEPASLSDLVPALGTQLVVPSVAGLKRLIVDRLAGALVTEGAKSREDFLAVYYPLFYQPKPVEKASQPVVGTIALGVGGAGASLTTLGVGDEVVRLHLDYRDSLAPLLAPDYGLAVRYRLGGTAREGIDYTIVGSGGIPIASIPAGESTGSLSLRIAPEALAAGDRFIQVELLSADSGMRVDRERAVVTIALGAAALPAGAAPTGTRTAFVAHELVTAPGDGPAVIRAPAGGSHVVLRGENGRADLFVVGDAQAAGIPFIENFRAADGDMVWIASGDLVAHRLSNLLADDARRTAALGALRARYGAGTITAMPESRLEALLANEIESATPLGAFRITELNTYGGFIFDVAGRAPVAMASDYSATAGDTAWASLSMNPNGRTAYATEVLLSGRSTATVADGAAAGTLVGLLSTSATDGGSVKGPFVYSIVGDAPGSGAFAIDGDRLVLARAADFETLASTVVRVRSVSASGVVLDGVVFVRVADVPEAPGSIALSSTSVPENVPAGTLVGTLSAADADLGERIVFSLVAGTGSSDNASFRIEGDRLVTASVFDREWLAERRIRIRATDTSGLWLEREYTIHVEDVPDTALDVMLAGTMVRENALPGAFIGALSVAGRVPGVMYRLVEGEGSSGNGLVRLQGNRVLVAATLDQETTPSFPIRVRATDRAGTTTETVFTITVRDVKERPTVTLPTAFAAVEDTPTKLVVPGVPFAVDDAIESTRIVVTLRVERGTLHAESAAGVTVGGTATARTLSGTLAALNAYVTDPAGRIEYRPARDDAGRRTLGVTLAESFRGGVLAVSSTATIVIAAADDAPTMRLPAAFRVTEDVPGRLAWPAGAFADVDSATLSLVLEAAAGTIEARAAAGVTVEGDGSRRTLRGSPAALSAFAALGRVGYVTEADGTAPRTLFATLSDGTTAVRREVPIVVVPVADRPLLAAAGSLVPGVGGAIGHADLVRATGARDADGEAVRFILEGSQGGLLERWDGARWTAVRGAIPVMWTGYPGPGTTVIGPRTILRWRSDGSGTKATLTLRGWDGARASAVACRVDLAAG
ncbi:MAG: hypothetical protein ACKO3G_06135 [Planctomycetaceae bacterium]